MAQTKTSDRILALPLPGFLVAGLLALVLGIVTVSTLTDDGAVRQVTETEILDERIMLVDGSITGAATITGADGQPIAEFADGEAVFITTIARVVERQRIKSGVPLDGPIHLRRRAPNRLSVYDPVTRAEFGLSSFGKDNIAAFAALLTDVPEL
ncbi:MAG: photosynthetic complex assembly protein PuhC [Pseudomonadota bacterium]